MLHWLWRVLRRSSAAAFTGVALAAAVAAALMLASGPVAPSGSGAAGGGGASGGGGSELITTSRHFGSASPRIPARIGCASVAKLDGLGDIPGFPTAISSATGVPAAGGNPAYCRSRWP